MVSLAFDPTNGPWRRSRGARRARQARFYLIGVMRAEGPDGENLLPRLRKSKGVLAYLCLTDGAPVPRSRLAAMLWGDSSDRQATASLRHALWELRQALLSWDQDALDVARETVRLDLSGCWIDAQDEPERGELLLEDLDGLSLSFDRWLHFERNRLEDRMRDRLEKELQRLIDEKAPPESRAPAARRLANFDPTHEGAVRALMIAFAQMGDRAQAIREYERCRQAMSASLDAVPSNETVAVYEAIRIMARPRSQVAAPRAATQILAEAAEIPGGSIAVLPFHNLIATGRRDHAAEGLAEDLTETLSRIPNLLVISRMSTLSFRAQGRLPGEIGEALGVRYVFSGGIGVDGNQLGLAAELTDTRIGTALWSSRIEERNFDLRELSDRLSNAILSRVAHSSGIAKGNRERERHPEAYELFLRAQENMHNSSQAVFETCERLLDVAIAIDPGYAAALAWRARWHLLRVAQRWSPDRAADTRQADHFAKRAARHDDSEPMALAIQGHIAAYLHRNFDLARRRFDRALRINPNAAPALLWSASTHAWMGDGPQAVAQIAKALTLSPYDPLMHAYYGIAGFAHLANGQPERAVEFGLRSIRENRSYVSGHHVLTISLALAGHLDQARTAARRLLQLDPGLTVEGFRRDSPTCAGPNATLFCDALASAGVPVSG